MENKTEAEILARLDLLVRLQALSMVSRFESAKDKIIFLNTVGLQPKEIAELLKTSPNTVSVTLSKTKKAPSKSTKEKE